MTKARGLFRFHGGRRMRVAPALALALVMCACRGPVAQAEDCRIGPQASAARNAVSLLGMAWSPFGRPEKGWAIYEALAAREISTACPADSPAFAARLAAWQGAHGIGAGGVADEATLERMKAIWQARRPFVAASRRACPAAPAEASLATAAPSESYGGKVIQVRSDAMAAYRRMAAAARSEVAQARADRRLFTIFSGYRSPAYDAARCQAQGNCQGVVRASCSAHRTGLALDLYLGAAPGFGPDSSADANRLFIARGAAYRWLVRNADRFGFANYPFEPWHWEWTRAGF